MTKKGYSAKMLTLGDGRRVYEVLKSGRRWVATHHVVRKTWHIENENRTRLDPYGDLAYDIIDACEAAARADNLELA